MNLGIHYANGTMYDFLKLEFVNYYGYSLIPIQHAGNYYLNFTVNRCEVWDVFVYDYK
jgi:hypothetical protein